MDILNFDYSSSLLPVRSSVGGMGESMDLRVREQVTVQLRTMDELVDESLPPGPIDLLRIDTQGTELDVLKGAGRCLKRVRLIWTEVSFRHLYEGSVLFSDVHAHLTREGFRFHSLHEGFRGSDRELLQADALFLGPTL